MVKGIVGKTTVAENNNQTFSLSTEIKMTHPKCWCVENWDTHSQCGKKFTKWEEKHEEIIGYCKGLNPNFHIMNYHAWSNNKAVLEPRVLPAFAFTYFCNHCNIRFDPYQNLNQRSLIPRWLLTPSLLRSHSWHYPRIIVSKSHENTSKYVDTVTFFKTWNQRSLTPRWPLTPSLLRSHVWLSPRIIVSKSHENTSKYVDTVTILSKT